MNAAPAKFDPLKALSLKMVRNRMAGRGGKRPHVDTLLKYVKVGCKLRSGPPVKLKAILWAGSWLVMPSWLADFEAARMEGGMT